MPQAHLSVAPYVRLFLLALCVLSLVPVAWRGREVAAALRRERDTQRLHQVGLEHALVGRWNQAATVFRQVTILAPYEPEAYASLADAEYRLGNVDAAVATYRRLLSIYPYMYDGGLYRDLGFLELRARRYADARADLAHAVLLDPSDWHAYFLLGHVHRASGDRRGARAAFQRVVELRPDFQPAHDQVRALDQ